MGFAFGFGDEFESEAVGVVIELEGVLKGDDFGVVPPEEVNVGVEDSLVLVEPAIKLLFFELNLPLKLLHQRIQLHLQLHPQSLDPPIQVLEQKIPLLQVELQYLALTRPDRPLENQLHRLALASDYARHPLHPFGQRAHAAFVRVHAAEAMVGETKGAKDGTMGAVEVCAEVSGSFPAVGEAGDNSRREGTFVKHKVNYKNLY